ncbi:MAG: adenylate/guanylate cyclase domain-containing response regulator [Nitrospirae bacterium]|nr:adenylate/guanylate cyclase domain-containing response regulator [Nitrospirota bacterium]
MAIILIIDDEQENLELLKVALGDENPDWDILTASSEADGEKILTDQLAKVEPVDVVLTDLVMESEASGMNILQKARRLDPLVMAILFTAKQKSLDRYAAFDYGAFDVVEKNIRGTAAAREINIKTRAALRYREWSLKINFLRRYFDPKVYNVIMREPSLLKVDNKTITIVFWDIRGFSRLCDSLKAHPTLISGFLREYCEIGARVIFEHTGVLDKFIGDGIMALFGVLNHKNDNGAADAVAAVNAAIKMRREVKVLIDKWLEEWTLYVPDEIDIGIGCGIHTGEVLVGNMGTEVRDQFTAVGSHVNFASRIEARSLSGQILLSQSTESRLKKIHGTFKILPAGTISDIKNIPGTFPVFEVVS